ncbi:MAG TPA: NAD(P)/FAD-dependent oxidoreductase [Microthrixaceae bacterium]|nr:NAD(P)/FAD-dependent oxidoreductase [Microthrixaceae bacterium]
MAEHRGAEFDVVVVGSGPNGLTAAIRCAQSGCSVLVLEAAETLGGGTRTKELTLPGFRHDMCSAVHPTGAASPAFRSMPLAEFGLEWIPSPIEAVNPFDDGSAGVLLRGMAATDDRNNCDGTWSRLLEPFVRSWPRFADRLLGPAVTALSAPWLLAQFTARALVPTTTIARRGLGPAAGAVFAGTAAHANTSLSRPLSAVGGLVLAAAAHVSGWPIARGGSQAIADALGGYLTSLGGTIECGQVVRSFRDLPSARAYLFDTTPWQLMAIAGERVPDRLRRRWARFRHGAASFKLDYALAGPMPWTNAEARRAVAVQLGGTIREISASEQAVWAGRVPDRPFVLCAQPSIVDASRAPAGHHTLWAYCHLPNGCTADMTGRIEAQFDRFAPGWRDLVLARQATGPADLSSYNENYRGGDIAAGATDGFQVLFRPDASLDPYRTPIPDMWLCSSSTPPGGGVHGLCGDRAARSVLKSL